MNLKLVKEYINEKFIQNSDPIKDMSIGMQTYDTLTKGAIIKAKKFSAIGRKSGKVVSWGKGTHIYKDTYLLITSVYHFYEDLGLGRVKFHKSFSVARFKLLDDAVKYKNKLPMLKAFELYNLTNKLNLKKGAFNSRFEVVENGYTK